LTVRGADDAESVLLQIVAREAGDFRFIVHDEDEGRHEGSIKVYPELVEGRKE